MKQKTKNIIMVACLALTMVFVGSAALKQAGVIQRDATDVIVDIVDAVDGEDVVIEEPVV